MSITLRGVSADRKLFDATKTFISAMTRYTILVDVPLSPPVILPLYPNLLSRIGESFQNSWENIVEYNIIYTC